MDEITVELSGSAAMSAHEIAKLQHVLPFDVANCAVMVGLEILRAEQDNQNGLVQKFIRTQQSDTLSSQRDKPLPELHTRTSPSA